MSNDPNVDAIVTFKEHVELLKKINQGFRYELFHNIEVKFTGCVWQTATMRDNFERFGGFAALDAMKCELKYLLCPHVAITMNNELEIICLGCESIVFPERKEACKDLLNFDCDEKHSSHSYDDTHVLTVDGTIKQFIVNH